MSVASDEDRATEVRSLVALMDAVLDAVVAAYAQASVDLPERRYWTLAPPAADCEQAVVSFNQAYYGPPGDQAAAPVRCDGPRSAALQIQVIRCVPTVSGRGKPPTPEQIQSASTTLAIDAYLLLDVVASLDQWDPLGGPGLGVIATVDAVEPEGGYQSITLNVSLAIP